MAKTRSLVITIKNPSGTIIDALLSVILRFSTPEFNVDVYETEE